MSHETDRPEGPGSKALKSAERKRSSLDRESRQAIGKQLRSLYDEVLNEPIPVRFAEILKRLDKSDSEDSGA